jgi:thiol-disulfide isomerase/thioredoxin
VTSARPAGHVGRITRGLIAALVLLVCGAAGFLLQRLAAPRPTLYSGSAAPPQSRAFTDLGPLDQPPPDARKVPERIPDLALPDPQGVIHRLSQWKGRPLVVNFWATWCEPCRREIPLLKTLRHERARDGLQIVGIAIDLRDSVRKYVAERGMDYPVLVAQQGGLEAAGAFGMDTVLPFSVFADGSGRVIALKVGELHRDEADLILDRIRGLEAGNLTLTDARDAISAGIRRLNAARTAPGTPAPH